MASSTTAGRGISPEVRKRDVRRHRGDAVPSHEVRVLPRHWQRVFEEIVIVDGPSAKDIAEITGLGQSTVSGVLEELRKRNLVLVEDPGERMGRGRRPRPIRVNEREHYVAGVEIVPDQVSGLVVDLCGQTVIPLKKITLSPTHPDVPVNPDMVVDRVRELVDELTAELHRVRDDARGRPLLGLGVEVGGHVDGRLGRVMYSPNLRWGGDWTAEPIPLRQRLRDATRLSTVVDNDVNATGVAQRWFGAARGLESFAVAYVTTDGIGGAIFDGGEPYHGATGKAAELGHLVIDRNGRRCRCGARGCVEAYATPAAVGKELGVSADAALRRAEEGDRVAQRAFADAGDALGRGVSIVLNLADPAKIIFTGDQVRPSRADNRDVLVNDEYHAAMRAAIKQSTFSAPPPDDAFDLVPDQGHWNGPRGAATLVIQHVIAGAIAVKTQDSDDAGEVGRASNDPGLEQP